MNTEQAVKHLTSELRKDPEFYYAYQANIAMSFVDAAKDFIKSEDREIGRDEDLILIANNGAKKFLDLFLMEQEKGKEIDENIERDRAATA